MANRASNLLPLAALAVALMPTGALGAARAAYDVAGAGALGVATRSAGLTVKVAGASASDVWRAPDASGDWGRVRKSALVGGGLGAAAAANPLIGSGILAGGAGLSAVSATHELAKGNLATAAVDAAGAVLGGIGAKKLASLPAPSEPLPPSVAAVLLRADGSASTGAPFAAATPNPAMTVLPPGSSSVALRAVFNHFAPRTAQSTAEGFAASVAARMGEKAPTAATAILNRYTGAVQFGVSGRPNGILQLSPTFTELSPASCLEP